MDNLGLVVSILAFLASAVFLVVGFIAMARKTGGAKKYFKYMCISLAVMIVGFVIFGVNSDSNVTEEAADSVKEEETVKKEVTSTKEKADAEAKKEAEETPQQKMLKSLKTLIDSKQAFDTGSYIQGDIPVGEYAFVSFKGSGKYYVEKDSADNKMKTLTALVMSMLMEVEIWKQREF